jgi:hypothetical protein
MTACKRRGKVASGNFLILETPITPSAIETVKPMQIFPGNPDFFVYTVSALQMIVRTSAPKLNRGAKVSPIAETFLAI